MAPHGTAIATGVVVCVKLEAAVNVYFEWLWHYMIAEIMMRERRFKCEANPGNED